MVNLRCVHQRLINSYFEDLWILDATMIPEIIDSANAMTSCIRKNIETEQRCIEDKDAHRSGDNLHR